MNGITVNVVIDKDLKNWLNNHFDKEIANMEIAPRGIVIDIIAALCDRGGFDDWWWGDLDVETRVEIQDELEEIVENYLQ